MSCRYKYQVFSVCLHKMENVRRNRRGAAVPRRMPVDTVDQVDRHIDLSIMPDTPPTAESRSVRRRIVPQPVSPPCSPTGECWRRTDDGRMEPATSIRDPMRRSASRLLLPRTESTCVNLERAFNIAKAYY